MLFEIQGEDRMEAKQAVILQGIELYNYSVLALSLQLCYHCLGGESFLLQQYQSSFSDCLFIHLIAAVLQEQMDQILPRSCFLPSK